MTTTRTAQIPALTQQLIDTLTAAGYEVDATDDCLKTGVFVTARAGSLRMVSLNPASDGEHYVTTWKHRSTSDDLPRCVAVKRCGPADALAMVRKFLGTPA